MKGRERFVTKEKSDKSLVMTRSDAVRFIFSGYQVAFEPFQMTLMTHVKVNMCSEDDSGANVSLLEG